MKYLSLAGLITFLPFSTLTAQSASHAMRPTSASSIDKPIGKPVARVNGAVLTDRDLLREMYTIFPYAKQHNGAIPKAMEADIKRGALQMLEFEELVYQDALRRKMAVPPAKMARALADFRKQFSTDAEFQQFIKADLNGSQDVLRSKVERSLLIEQELKTEVSDKAPISAVQLKDYYDKNPDRFKTPETLTFQTISVLVGEKDTPTQLKDARKRAEEMLRQAKATKSYEEFGMLAEKISEDDFRVVMGDHKAMERAKLPPEVIQVTNTMKEGQMSELIQIGPSYCVLRLNAHTPPGEQSFETVRKSLREELVRSRTEKLRSSLDKKLRATAKIEEL